MECNQSAVKKFCKFPNFWFVCQVRTGVLFSLSTHHFRPAWVRRREGPNLPAPALAEVVSKGESQRVIRDPFYDTQERALAEAAIRNQGKDIPAPPCAFQSTE
jgi:hypothetical protein